MTNAQIGAALIVVGPYIAVEVCKAVFKLQGPVCRAVNTLASTAIGVGVVLIGQGEPLERAALGAVAAGIAWLAATGVHGGLDRARAALSPSTNGGKPDAET